MTSPRAISHPPSPERIPWLHPAPHSPVFTTPSGLPSFSKVEGSRRPGPDFPPRAPPTLEEMDELISRSLTGFAQGERDGRPSPEAIAAVEAGHSSAPRDDAVIQRSSVPRAVTAPSEAVLTSALQGVSGAVSAATVVIHRRVTLGPLPATKCTPFQMMDGSWVTPIGIRSLPQLYRAF